MKAYDCIVVGAGAAGLACSSFIARRGRSVLLLDGRKKIGAKILMSGGTRCNITNEAVLFSDYASEHMPGVRAVLKAFGSDDAIKLFRTYGLETVREKTGKIFPKGNDAKAVLETLLYMARECGAELVCGKKVSDIDVSRKLFSVRLDDGSDINSPSVVICTGGLSFPMTGSDGFAFRLAKKIGVRTVKTFPSLTPLTCYDDGCHALSGVSVNAEVSCYRNGKKIKSFTGSLLFTHFGFSGPPVLNISRFLIEGGIESSALQINFLPDSSRELYRSDLTASSARNKKLKALLLDKLPVRVVEWLLSVAGIQSDVTPAHLKKKDAATIENVIFAYRPKLKGYMGFEKAEVTAGGIDLKELDKGTLESKKYPGLFFAGEALDADGRIGGFNFQWAWSSAKVAADGVLKRLG